MDIFIPAKFKSEFDNYILFDQQPSRFISQVLCNKLTGAVEEADAEALDYLPQIAMYMFNYLPRAAWGSFSAMDKWLSSACESKESAQDMYRQRILSYAARHEGISPYPMQ